MEFKKTCETMMQVVARQAEVPLSDRPRNVRGVWKICA